MIVPGLNKLAPVVVRGGRHAVLIHSPKFVMVMILRLNTTVAGEVAEAPALDAAEIAVLVVVVIFGVTEQHPRGPLVRTPRLGPNGDRLGERPAEHRSELLDVDPRAD